MLYRVVTEAGYVTSGKATSKISDFRDHEMKPNALFYLNKQIFCLINVNLWQEFFCPLILFPVGSLPFPFRKPLAPSLVLILGNPIHSYNKTFKRIKVITQNK